jgi:hypothetical protein
MLPKAAGIPPPKDHVPSSAKNRIISQNYSISIPDTASKSAIDVLIFRNVMLRGVIVNYWVRHELIRSENSFNYSNISPLPLSRE